MLVEQAVYVIGKGFSVLHGVLKLFAHCIFQEHCLNVHEEFGAHCYIVVSIQFRNYYRVPWNVFRDMQEIYGHKYMNEENLEQFKISNTGGILRFLDGIEIEEKGKA